MRITEVYFEIASYIYLSIILIFYLKKKKVNTFENKIYKAMIVTAVLVCFTDAVSTLMGLEYPDALLTEILIKWKLINMALEMLFCTYYIFCITSKKSVGIVDIEEHPHKKHFQKYAAINGIASIIFVIAISIGSLDVGLLGGKFYYEGTALDACQIATVGSAVLWLIMFLKVLKDIRNKKYRQLLILLAVGGVTILVTIIFPTYSFSTPSIAFITAVIFFTMENPDASLIYKLNDAKSNAENANKTKTDFLSSMSHEIRTPLNAIVGFSQALAKEDISGTAKEEVKDIIIASNNLIEIVNGILDISKIEANKIEIIDNEYSSRNLIHEVVTLVNARIGSKPLEFKVELDENLPPVLYGDVLHIKQIIINLLTNAVKYTNEGYIRLSIKCLNRGDISHITISVEDSGMGMTEKDIELLFTKFQRFDMEKNANVEGTGLGMAITKGLLDLMKGTIDVKSEYGKGSTFIVNLDQKIIEKDAAEIVEQEQEKKSVIVPFNATGKKILVVDDNKINLKVAARLLREYNTTVELVDNGPECISRILDGKEYDLIFMDIMMPKMKGTEVLRNLKNINGFNIPVVALTADVIAGMEEKYISQGFDDCLAKPIVEEELYYMLKKFIYSSISNPEEPVEQTEYVNTNEPVEKSSPASEETTEQTGVELLEANGINVSVGLELLKDMEMYNMTLEEFYTELPEKLENLKEFKENKDMDNYGILAHGLKSEARYVGCNTLGDIAYEHELAGKESNQNFVDQKYEVLAAEANRVYEVIKKYFN